MADIIFISKAGRVSGSHSVSVSNSSVTTPLTIDGCLGVSILTHIGDQSTKVVNGDDTDAFFVNGKVSAWTLQGNTMQIMGPNPISLNFINQTEAALGESRFASSLNGNTI